MSEERLEQVEQKLDSLISAIQTGFGNFQLNLTIFVVIIDNFLPTSNRFQLN